MSTTRAIYIQGGARSGNTLMRELCVAGFYGAELVKVSADAAECSLSHLIGLLSERLEKSKAFSISHLAKSLFEPSRKRPALLVASRDRYASRSFDLDLLRANPGVKVLWMLRNPLDVLTSVHEDRPGEFFVTPQKLLNSLELYDRFKNESQVLTVHYEQLVSDPSAAQARIAQEFQIKPARDFTEGYKHFPSFAQNVRAMHSIRPIDAASVQKWKTNSGYRKYLETVLAEHPLLISRARDCGYEINLT